MAQDRRAQDRRRKSMDEILAEGPGGGARPSMDDLLAEPAAPSPTQTRVRQALKTPEGKRRLQRGNDEKELAEMPTLTDALVRPITEAFETVAAGVPGVKTAISGYRNLLKPSADIADIQREVNEETSDIPYASAIGRAAGSLATPGLSRMTAAKAGGTLAGASELLSNDQSGLGERVGRTAVAVPLGVAAGKAGEMIASGARMLGAKGGEAAKDAALTTRSEGLGSSLYNEIRKQPAQAMTKEMGDVLAHSDIAPVAEKILKLKQFEGKELTDPNVLIGIRKALTDWGHQLDKQGAVLDPGKPNMIAETKEHIALLKEAFDAAADKQVPGFARAVSTFADESVPLSGQEAGYDAMRRAVSGNLTTWKNLGKKTPGALDSFLKTKPDAGRGASEGVLAAGRDAFGNGKRLTSLYEAGPLLQKADKAAGRGNISTPNMSLMALLNALSNP